jgi:HD-GYP domain-containing protein (c-di-GMP phosphodiesterase class II)
MTASGGCPPPVQQTTDEAWRVAAAARSADELLAALAVRDGYSERAAAVVELSLGIGRRLGMSEFELTNLHWVALLHDIAKLGIPEEILLKPGPLTLEERADTRRQAEVGERVIAGIEPLAHLTRSVRAGHERWDGTGYPDGLLGDEIPLRSRIVMVSDAYRAMTSERPYRPTMSSREARSELEQNAGTQFCPEVTAVALAVLADADDPA